MRPPILLDDATFNERVAKLIAALGILENTDLTLEDIADLVHTRMHNINPNPSVSAAMEQAPKPKKEKITGAKLEDLLG